MTLETRKPLTKSNVAAIMMSIRVAVDVYESEIARLSSEGYAEDSAGMQLAKKTYEDFLDVARTLDMGGNWDAEWTHYEDHRNACG